MAARAASLFRSDGASPKKALSARVLVLRDFSSLVYPVEVEKEVIGGATTLGRMKRASRRER